MRRLCCGCRSSCEHATLPGRVCESGQRKDRRLAARSIGRSEEARKSIVLHTLPDLGSASYTFEINLIESTQMAGLHRAKDPTGASLSMRSARPILKRSSHAGRLVVASAVVSITEGSPRTREMARGSRDQYGRQPSAHRRGFNGPLIFHLPEILRPAIIAFDGDRRIRNGSEPTLQFPIDDKGLSQRASAKLTDLPFGQI